MDALVAKHKDIQIKILEYIDNESNNEDDKTAFLNYLTNMDLNIYEVNLILHFLSIISCNHHRNFYFFIKIKQIIEFYMKIIKENFSSSLISDIFRKNKLFMLFFYEEKILNIVDLVKQSSKYNISDFFCPEIKPNIFELIKNNEVFNIIVNNIKYYLDNDIFINMNDYPLLNSFLYGNTNQDSDSFVFNKIKSFLEKTIDKKIKELSYFFLLYSKKDNIKENERELHFNAILFFNFCDRNVNNIFEIFYSKLLFFNGDLDNNRNSNQNNILNIKRPYNYNGYYSESTINKCMKNEKYIYKMFFNFIIKVISKKGNKYVNLYIRINKFFKYAFGPVLKMFFFKIFFEDQREKQNDKDQDEKQNDKDQDEKQKDKDQDEKQKDKDQDEKQKDKDQNEKQNDSSENDVDQDYLNEEEDIQNDLDEEEEEEECCEECYEDDLLYQKMYPKIKKFLDDTKSQMNTTKVIKYQQISSKVISFCDEIINDELEYEFNEIFKPCFNQDSIQDESFEANRQKGENESYICQLIRDDRIKEFIIYTNKMNYPLKKSIIPSSIFETNSFLINKETSLIEYAAFFGSIQIFQYLLLNDVELRPELWLYAIHGRNAEIIHMIEENHIQPADETYSECLITAIKCYHNEIATYIQDNLYEKKNCSNFIREDFPLIILSYDMNKKIKKNDEAIDLKIIKTFNIEFFSDVDHNNVNYNSSLFKYDSQISYIEFLLWTNDENNKSLILKIASHTKKLSGVVDYILSTLTEIKPAAFKHSSILKISIPNSIRLIDNEAFYKSQKLTEIVIPSSVIEIRNKAFYGCYSLEKVILSPSIKKLGDFVFSQCSSLKQIIIPSSVTHIGDYAFNQCKSLSFVSIPPSVISIGKYAFRECTSLEKITIPSSLTKIGEHAFNDSSLKYVLIISSNKSIENNVFPPQTYVIQIILE